MELLSGVGVDVKIAAEDLRYARLSKALVELMALDQLRESDFGKVARLQMSRANLELLSRWELHFGDGRSFVRKAVGPGALLEEDCLEWAKRIAAEDEESSLG